LKEDNAAHKLAMAQKIADKSVPIKGTPAEAYVKARGISIGSLAPEALRDLQFCPAEGKYPTMLVAIVPRHHQRRAHRLHPSHVYPR
jgi:hypothetical protein